MRPEESLLPTPGVRFSGDYARRVASLSARLAALEDRREGAGRSWLLGEGEEFVGYRPYRPGEDLRRLDWALYARLSRPYVRVMRREATEQWAIVLDASASMGVGRPGKLQSAAEVALAMAAIGLRAGARVEIVVAGGSGPRELTLRRSADWSSALERLGELRAGGQLGLAARSLPGRLRSAGRVLLLGDLFDLTPGDALRFVRRGRSLELGQVLAPEELSPALGEAVEWVDPEGGGRRRLLVDGATGAAYERALEQRLHAWRQLAARHRLVYACWSSEAPFEEPSTSLCAP